MFLTEYGKSLLASGSLKEAESVFAEAWGRLKAVESVSPAYFKDVFAGFIGLFEAWNKVRAGQGFSQSIGAIQTDVRCASRAINLLSLA